MGNIIAKWSIPLEELAQKSNKTLLLTVQKSALFMFNRVIMLSPVRTGRFRGNWLASLNGFNATTLDDTDSRGDMTMIAAKNVVVSMKIGDVAFLCNSLPYAQRLEYGWSQQAPSGMVRITISEFAATVERAIAESKEETR